MKVTIIQLDIEWGRPLENIRRAERLITSTPDSDLYVLPEMWATGFATEPTGIAEPEDRSVALQWMRTIANEKHCAIAGSLAIQTSDGSFHNRHYFINGRKAYDTYYDKYNLFHYGGETRFYTAGKKNITVEYEGVIFLLVTCFDMRFPEWIRYSEQKKYDAIICVANWPESRQNAWQILTRARAIENQAYLIGCNRVGDDHYSHYKGMSAVISPIGKTIVSGRSNIEQVISAEIDVEHVYQLRNKFKVLPGFKF